MCHSLPYLLNAKASEVLGEYEHSFSIDPDSNFAIIFGPNGVGKTKFLEIIHWTVQLNGYRLSRLPFTHASLSFSDGTQISVQREEMSKEEEEVLPFSLHAVSFSMLKPGGEPLRWEFRHNDFMRFVRRRIGPGTISEADWQDGLGGEESLMEELRAQYDEHLSRRSAMPSRYQRPPQAQDDASELHPSAAQEFFTAVSSFLIETQRLRIEIETERSGLEPRQRHTTPKSKPKIKQQAETMRSLLNKAQTEHSRTTQKLDRTFPHRVLEADRGKTVAKVDEIRQRYDRQNEFRSRLARIASVPLGEALPLPDRELELWELTLLSQYLEDTDQKFVPFEGLVNKIELLEEIINSRLLRKTLQVTDQEGLSVRHSETNEPIDLESLSSGEQHVIILMIDLLFNVPRGAIVLVDEPEISLHVAWQIAFIPDVVRIASLVGFQFIVATHSPQIINDKWDQATALGSSENSFA